MRRIVLAAFAVSVFVACQPADTATEWQPIIDAYRAAWNTGDFSGLDAVFAQDFVRSMNGEVSSVGLDSLRVRMAEVRTAFPDFHVTVEELIAVGDRATWRWVIAGTSNSLDMQTTATGVSVLRKENGQLLEELADWDALAWNLGLGYVLTPPSDSGG